MTAANEPQAPRVQARFRNGTWHVFDSWHWRPIEAHSVQADALEAVEWFNLPGKLGREPRHNQFGRTPPKGARHG